MKKKAPFYSTRLVEGQLADGMVQMQLDNGSIAAFYTGESKKRIKGIIIDTRGNPTANILSFSEDTTDGVAADAMTLKIPGYLLKIEDALEFVKGNKGTLHDLYSPETAREVLQYMTQSGSQSLIDSMKARREKSEPKPEPKPLERFRLRLFDPNKTENIR